MVATLIAAVLASCFLAGFGLRMLGLHWLLAWFLGAMVFEGMLLALLLFDPSEYAGIALVMGGIVGATLSGLGVLSRWLLARKDDK